MAIHTYSGHIIVYMFVLFRSFKLDVFKTRLAMPMYIQNEVLVLLVALPAYYFYQHDPLALRLLLSLPVCGQIGIRTGRASRPIRIIHISKQASMAVHPCCERRKDTLILRAFNKSKNYHLVACSCDTAEVRQERVE